MKTHAAHKKWVRTLPKSKMVYPKKLDKKVRYVLWRAFTPLHPFFRELCMPVRHIRGRSRRQEYLLGTLVVDRTLEQLVSYLISHGYRRHHVAWRDPGEFLSLRLVEDFDWQYHLRIFHDREVRGHYEYTPESYPFKHLKKVNMQDRREEFLSILGGWITPSE